MTRRLLPLLALLWCGTAPAGAQLIRPEAYDDARHQRYAAACAAIAASDAAEPGQLLPELERTGLDTGSAAYVLPMIREAFRTRPYRDAMNHCVMIMRMTPR